jgi:hypothetical protein
MFNPPVCVHSFFIKLYYIKSYHYTYLFNITMLTKLFMLFFLMNAIFWGLFPHSVHCQFVSNTFGVKCPPHIVHLLIGILSFLIAMYLAQKEYIHSLLFDMKELMIGGMQIISNSYEQFTSNNNKYKL